MPKQYHDEKYRCYNSKTTSTTTDGVKTVKTVVTERFPKRTIRMLMWSIRMDIINEKYDRAEEGAWILERLMIQGQNKTKLWRQMKVHIKATRDAAGNGFTAAPQIEDSETTEP